MRTYNSIKNMTVSMALGVIAIIVGFIAQKVFIEHLGVDYLGINGLFTNIVMMLAIAELGLGVAIIYHLYAPLEVGDVTKVKSLMSFYRKGYRVIALIVLLLGLAMMPFLTAMVDEVNIPVNLYIIYLLFICNATVSYLLAYKRSILYADQKNYVINAVRITSLIALSLLQIIVLIYTQNYYLYLVMMIIMTITENIVLNHIVDKRYRYLNDGQPALAIDKKTKKDIYQKVKGLLYHKAGTFLVLGSDNIIIAAFLGVVTVGLYSNYLLIITAVNTLFSQLTTALTASIGNLLLTKDKDRHYEVFKKIFFANFWIGVVCVVVFMVAADSFIALWIGERFVLPFAALLALSVNLYLTLTRSPFHGFKTAAGIFYEDRFVPLVEAAVNIIFSIVLLHFFGLAGVFMGTICSSLVLYAYSYPRFIYNGLFGRGYFDYTWYFMKHLLIALTIGTLAYITSRAVEIDDTVVRFVLNIFIAFITANGILYLLFRKSDEYAYYKGLLKKMTRRAFSIQRGNK